MTSFEPGEVILVQFPFTDLERTKRRPALVLASSEFNKYRLYNVAMITSSEGIESHISDVPITDLSAAGLPHASTARLAKIATIDGGLIEKRLGKISAVDRESVKRRIHKLFKAWL